MNQLSLRSIISLLTLSTLVFSCQNESNGSFYKNISLGLLHQLSSKVNFFQSATTSNAVVGPTQLIYVSESLGDDLTNDGTSPDPIAPGVGPFKTIEKALLTAKTLRTNQTTANLYAPIKILIRSGRYYLTQPLEITSELSGKGLDSALTITRYSNEHPIISGGRPVINWVLSNPAKKIWVADYPDNSIQLNPLPGNENDEKTDLLHNFWVNDRWAVKARYPKNDSYYSEPEKNLADQWMYVDSNLSNGKLINSASGVSYVNVGFDDWDIVKNWNIQNSEITIYANDYSLLSYRLIGTHLNPADSPKGYYKIQSVANNLNWNSPYYFTRFFVSNVFEQLTRENEWYLDKVNRKVYYIPIGSADPNLSSSPLVISALTSIVNIAGTQSQPAEYIIIDGLTFSETATTFAQNTSFQLDGAVRVKWGKNIWITNNYLHNLSGSGVHMDEGSTLVTTIRNVISDVGHSGVIIGDSTRISTTFAPYKNVIQGNYIVRSGLSRTLAGILIVASNENSVFNNQIYHSTAHGIATSMQYEPDLPSKSNGITGNEIYYSVLRSADQGGIYIAGSKEIPVTGNWITENRVLQSQGATRGTTWIKNILKGGADGIFLDDYSSGNFVKLNVVSNVTRASIHINAGSANRIHQNLLANGVDSIVMPEVKAGSLSGNEFYLNFAVNSFPSLKIWNFLGDPTPVTVPGQSFSWIDGNMYWRSFDNSWPFGDYSFGLNRRWFDWQAMGVDNNSGYATQNPGAQLSSDGSMVLGNSIGGWTSAVGYGPGSGLLTGLRRFAVVANDPAASCINTFFGSQYSPIFNVDPKLFYTTCIAP
ncbi:right-handed parallel beta-helix repeat-containing protein [Leptospira yasudae]|uniref:right-handed parallel beta-helix repeat-containing protein n=1 Tax=Leptospira yasudae TaxID=2202201 RepID=UPI00143845BF|nr:right-handed parallel beta-helix repeat-containing protein [Leptospira yasudae]